MTSKAQIKASTKYNAANTTQVIIRLNIRNDEDIINKLNSVPSKMGYIKQLIRDDIKHDAN